ncbi:ABC transporter ATP-binding protein [Gilliamella sp. B14448G11]|uniref:ABC transporter ATP-binding protein n=1 Tax=unclassified Gilliamella TaxID=2685620 RepID=UPI0018DC8594|nr:MULTISPECIES: ABC transporter ATP-binding protein [unclassified Gilliamella]MBI0027594.1 ABC transporter ATP-binding protein [Gilliamella sp. B14448G7]MBI0030034.1 ABC transporter ATP-binding protein [Gilliamella sp. B14384G15]MBI0034914.1 ABC transporter ATP-binding protein [Gilliamella sp. B14448G11]MBI0041418.1 ABC transporter ATP-binding protein [Gilliamella sp. B14448G12]MBI0057190.1 ABC transporter ATP-binding protein [Gilliamella sp. B14384G12]
MYRFFEKLVSPYPKDDPQPAAKNFFSFIWQSTKGTRVFMLLLIILSGLSGAFEAFLFAALGKVVDWLAEVEPSKFWQQEKTTLILLALIILASTLIISLQTIIKHQCLAGNFPMRMRWNLHRLVLNQSMRFFQDEFAGRISAKVMQTALAVRDTCFLVADIFIYVLISFITMAAIIGQLDLWLLMPFLGWTVLYGIAMYYFIPRLGKVASMQADARSTMTGRVTDAYTNIMTVKLFSHAGNEAKYAQESMDEFLVTVNRQMRLVSSFEIVNHLLSITLILCTTGVALWLWTDQLVGVGAIATTTAVALRLNGFSHWIMWEMAALFENIGVVKDGINTFSSTKTVNDQPNATELVVKQGKIDFQHINFNYDAKRQNSIIQDLDLTINPGEKIGLVGRSGAGKSTLINLLLRFYDLQSGKIIIDGQEITTVTQESLRAQIGMVTQDTSLLHRSVRENLLYGNNQATEEEMIIAAKKAHADSFIHTLVDANGRTGYDAFVGERGIKLSGGQRQRIAIARVILKNAPILLLDEATSALDSEIEQAIQESLYTLMEGKTVIAIAHRLSTIAAMDRLVVLDQGRIIEQGTHQELLDKNGLYAQLWKHQSGGFLGENI